MRNMPDNVLTHVKLRYGNTNTFLVWGEKEYHLLVDTDWAGTMPGLAQALKQHAGLRPNGIDYVMATHYHPDHAGIIDRVVDCGAHLVVFDVQAQYVGFSDAIFARERRHDYVPIDLEYADVIAVKDSREFLAGIGIDGEVISTPSHSPDSVSLVLDNGICFVGDLEPYEYLEAYAGSNPQLEKDWDAILSYNPRIVYYGHANEKRFR